MALPRQGFLREKHEQPLIFQQCEEGLRTVKGRIGQHLYNFLAPNPEGCPGAKLKRTLSIGANSFSHRDFRFEIVKEI
jgi:hypothetical protein